MHAGFGFFSAADAKDSDRDIAQLRQGGLGLPDRDYYLNDDDKSKAIRAEYVAHVSKTLQLLGDTPAAADVGAQAVLRLETELAKASLSREVLRNPYASYHKMAVADLPKYTGELDWPAFFRGVGAPAFSEVNFQQPDFFRAFSAQLMSSPIADWQTYLRWHLGRHASPYLSDAFVQEDYHFYNETLTGTKGRSSRVGSASWPRWTGTQARPSLASFTSPVTSRRRQRPASLSWSPTCGRAPPGGAS